METKETIIFNRIRIQDLRLEEIAESFRAWKYSEEKGIGFTYVHVEDDSIVANVLIKTPSYVQNYNSQDNVFEKRIVYIYDECQFVLDYRFGLIISTSTLMKFNKAKSLLRSCLKSNISFENIECSVDKMFKRIGMLNWKPVIVDLSIKKFIYKEGATGRLTVHVEKPEIGEELLGIYSNNINRMTVLVNSEDFSTFMLSFSSQNSFTFRCEEAEFWPIVNLIKQIL